ncbi:MAG: hypothetical protein K2Y37_11220 [Pirellulales bacterium]|nr:hypothetical protein [Pirellulales bacterium]
MCRVFLPNPRGGARLTLRLAMSVLALSAPASVPSTARAADAVLTTTELGVTVTSKELFDALHESNNFWPVVQRHVLSDDFPTGDAASRREAAAIISKVRSHLHEQLFGRDDAAAEDLLNYVGWSLRRARFYRELREVIGDPTATVQLRDTWQDAYRLHIAPDKPHRVEPMLDAVGPQLDALRLPAEKHARAVELFGLIGACAARMEATEAGQLIRQIDRDLGDTPTGELVRSIVAAADWASIIKPLDEVPRKKHFLAAWNELHSQSRVENSTAIGR